MHENSRGEAGFTLIELAVVILISGLLIGALITMITPYLRSAQYTATKEKMENIADALALYAQNYGRLPCPASALPVAGEPFGAPRNWLSMDPNAANDPLRSCGGGTATEHIGILPFRALGLTEDNARDGYGRLITYAVAPTLAGRHPSGMRVHQQCRVEDRWVVASSNLNPAKAQICCPDYIGAGTEITILDSRTGGSSLFSGTHSTTSGLYRDVNEPYASSSVDPNTRLVAYVLVSHGYNGDGAFIANSNTLLPVTADAGAQESENRNGGTANFTFVQRPLSTASDTNYFDDIVVWKTNDQVGGAFGNRGCAKP